MKPVERRCVRGPHVRSALSRRLRSCRRALHPPARACHDPTARSDWPTSGRSSSRRDPAWPVAFGQTSNCSSSEGPVRRHWAPSRPRSGPRLTIEIDTARAGRRKRPIPAPAIRHRHGGRCRTGLRRLAVAVHPRRLSAGGSPQRHAVARSSGWVGDQVRRDEPLGAARAARSECCEGIRVATAPGARGVSGLGAVDRAQASRSPPPRSPPSAPASSAGIAMAPRTPMIATTISSSMSVKPGARVKSSAGCRGIRLVLHGMDSSRSTLVMFAARQHAGSRRAYLLPSAASRTLSATCQRPRPHKKRDARILRASLRSPGRIRRLLEDVGGHTSCRRRSLPWSSRS